MCKYLTNILYFAIINVIVPEEPFPDVLRRTTNPRHGSVVGLSSHIEIVLLLFSFFLLGEHLAGEFDFGLLEQEELLLGENF